MKRAICRVAALCGSLCIQMVVTGEEAAEAAAGKIARLRGEIARHDRLYFGQAAPEISDAQYDALRRELDALERDNPGAAAAAAPLEEADDGGSGGRLGRAGHRVPMTSLRKGHTEDDLRAFHWALVDLIGEEEPDYWIEPKVDGAAISAVYENGRLARVVTRGDGRQGEDITPAMAGPGRLPATLATVAAAAAEVPLYIELRGEAYIPLAEFARLNRERVAAGESPYATPRNLAAGTVRLADAEAAAMRGLAVVFFGWGEWQPAETAPRSHAEFLQFLRANALPGLDMAERARGIDAVAETVARMDASRADWAFAADGLVVKLDRTADREAAGEATDGPRWALACKFPGAMARTTLTAVTWQVGRSGLLTPVAELQPLELGGRTITRASLHSRSLVEAGDYRPGDTVFVKLSGDVIPALAGVDYAQRTPESVPAAIPVNCPACGTGLAGTQGDAVLRCPSVSCPAQVKARLVHFVTTLGIGGLGPAVMIQLIEAGALTDWHDVYRLGFPDLAGLNIRGPVATQVLRNIERSKRTEPWRQIAALGLPGVGPAKARELAKLHGSLAAFIDACAEDFEPAVRQSLRRLAEAMAPD